MDPQLDSNALIELLDGDPDFVAFAQANRAAGLTYNVAVRAEFLANGLGTQADLKALAQTWGATLTGDITEAEIEAVADRLRDAFHGDSLGRVLHLPDARVLATGLLKHEAVATHELRMFKRARDLGLAAVFVGSGGAAARAVAYVRQALTIPSGA